VRAAPKINWIVDMHPTTPKRNARATEHSGAGTRERHVDTDYD